MMLGCLAWFHFCGCVQASSEGVVQNDPQAHEQEPRDLKKGISIKNLTKIYSQVMVADTVLGLGYYAK